MTTDPAQGATWGAPGGEPPATPKKSWSGRKTAIAAGVAVVIAVGGGLAIWAGTSANDASAQQSPGSPGGPGGFRGGQGFGGQRGPGAFGGAAALRNALHGDFVVTAPTGGYTTERLQTGAITEISATSVTLTSKDGYKQTYVLDASTQKPTTTPKTGDNVTVLAKLDGATATATSLEPATTATRPTQPGTGGQPGQGRRRYGNN
ncbi:hypothetical protein ACWEOE_32885 [Amycolatopsis sp. NPDC004368]